VGEKSIEGSLACLSICSVVGGIFLGWIGILGAIIATLSELAPLPVDDNLRIPLISGFIMHVLS
jgi:glycerol-3-phosphate acyltransferase PlsY